MEIKVDTTYKNKYRKMSSEELREYMFFKRRGFVVGAKKGKGSFKRKDKYPQKYED